MKGNTTRPWRGQRYGWNKPHHGFRARLRRLRQIVAGTVQADAEERRKAHELILQIAKQAGDEERRRA